MLQILLITSSNGHWIFPKGTIKKKETARDAAIRETFEECGVTGRIGNELGRWFDKKKNVYVTYFLLFIEEQMDSWLEEKERIRKWYSLTEAQSAINRKFLLKVLQEANKELINKFDGQPGFS